MRQFFILHDAPRQQYCIDYIAGLPVLTPTYKPVSVEIKEYRKNRSTSQNRTMWMWLNAMSPDTGNEPDDLHELFKQKFLGLEEKIVTMKRNGVYIREALVRPKSTARLSVGEFSDYLRKIEMTAIQMDIRLPYPDDIRYAMTGAA